MIIKTTSLALALGAIPALASAQVSTKDVKPYNADMFADCLGGNKDVGTEYGISDPLQIIGALVYQAKSTDNAGKEITYWARQPIAVPISVTQNNDIDTTACEHIFSSANNASFSVLGVGFSGEVGDTYRMDVRQISRQAVSDVIQGGIPVKVWTSNQYKPSFAGGVNFTNASITDFKFFDTLIIYVLRVERYKKVKGGLGGAIGWLSGGWSYQRDNSFKGTRIIATGTSALLARSAFMPGVGITPPTASPNSINVVPEAQTAPAG